MEIKGGQSPQASSEPLCAAEVTVHSTNHGQKHFTICIITLLLSPEAGSLVCWLQNPTSPCLEEPPAEVSRLRSHLLAPADPPVWAVTLMEQLLAVAPWAGCTARLWGAAPACPTVLARVWHSHHDKSRSFGLQHCAGHVPCALGSWSELPLRSPGRSTMNKPLC